MEEVLNNEVIEVQVENGVNGVNEVEEVKNEEQPQIGKFQMAAIKRTYATVKPMYRKLGVKQEKLRELLGEVEEYMNMIKQFESPVAHHLNGKNIIEFINNDNDKNDENIMKGVAYIKAENEVNAE